MTPAGIIRLLQPDAVDISLVCRQYFVSFYLPGVVSRRTERCVLSTQIALLISEWCRVRIWFYQPKRRVVGSIVCGWFLLDNCLMANGRLCSFWF